MAELRHLSPQEIASAEEALAKLLLKLHHLTERMEKTMISGTTILEPKTAREFNMPKEAEKLLEASHHNS